MNKRNIHIVETSQFGTALRLYDLMKEGQDIVILFEDAPTLKFVGIYLTHQIYLERFDPNKKYMILPASSNDYIQPTKEVMDLARLIKNGYTIGKKE